ncbi:hypothetical protein C0Q70_21042 [Pomacea canaliculata]|uniref:Uncharacterized protein n=1 Tax=Pomacea canaliculata TaxID=400727 RepID=A0A2T7NBF0_POMCA|nr:hypothetical protein C0Q70_21042 [Pomacea canaliculata]
MARTTSTRPASRVGGDGGGVRVMFGGGGGGGGGGGSSGGESGGGGGLLIKDWNCDGLSLVSRLSVSATCHPQTDGTIAIFYFSAGQVGEKRSRKQIAEHKQLNDDHRQP